MVRPGTRARWELVVAEEELETNRDGDNLGEQEQEVRGGEGGAFGPGGKPNGRGEHEAGGVFEQGAEADRSDEQISDYREPGQSHGNQKEGFYPDSAFGQSFSPRHRV